MNVLLQLLANGIVTASLIGVLACGFGTVYRSLRVFHLAYAGLMLIAPYTADVLHGLGLHHLAACAVGVVASATGGLLIELCLYRPFSRRRCSPGATMVASLGVLMVIENALAIAFGADTRTIERGLASRYTAGGVSLTSVQLLQLAICLSLIAGFVLATRYVASFRVIWAMGDQPGLIPVLGLPLEKFRVLVFVLSSAMAGVAGCLIGYDVGVQPYMGMTYLLLAAVAVLTGGVGRISGWLAGSAILALLQSVALWKLSSQWVNLMTFGLLLGVLIFRPSGIIVAGRRLEEG